MRALFGHQPIDYATYHGLRHSDNSALMAFIAMFLEAVLEAGRQQSQTGLHCLNSTRWDT
jgi:hypothetical protein